MCIGLNRSPHQMIRGGTMPQTTALSSLARTAGDARIVAASRELDFMEIDAAPAEDVTTSNASAFRDDKLYTVVELERGRSDLKRGVLGGNVSVNTIISTQT